MCVPRAVMWFFLAFALSPFYIIFFFFRKSAISRHTKAVGVWAELISEPLNEISLQKKTYLACKKLQMTKQKNNNTKNFHSLSYPTQKHQRWTWNSTNDFMASPTRTLIATAHVRRLAKAISATRSRYHWRDAEHDRIRSASSPTTSSYAFTRISRWMAMRSSRSSAAIRRQLHLFPLHFLRWLSKLQTIFNTFHQSHR